MVPLTPVSTMVTYRKTSVTTTVHKHAATDVTATFPRLSWQRVNRQGSSFTAVFLGHTRFFRRGHVADVGLGGDGDTHQAGQSSREQRHADSSDASDLWVSECSKTFKYQDSKCVTALSPPGPQSSAANLRWRFCTVSPQDARV